MKKLKLFFACLLMSILSIGQMWATDVTYTFTSKSWADASSAWTGGGDGNGFTNGQGIQVTTGTTGANATSNSSFSNVSKVVVTYNTNKSKGAGSIAIKIGTNDEVSNSVAYSGSADGTSANFTTQFDFSPVQTGAIKITTNTTNNSIWVKSITITYSDGGTPDPTVSADPEEVEDVPVAGVTNQTIDLTYENISDYETQVSVHPNADGTGTLSPAWLTASVSDADDYATVTYSVSANEGAARTAYIKVYTTDGDKEAETIIPVSQAKYSAPTGTFELFSGALEEGDYVIYYSGKAMKNTVSSSRLDYTEVTPSENKITNPDVSLIWHIAASGDYWTIYNAAVEKYAAGTGTKNQGGLLDSGSDDKSLWTASGTSTYEFVNKKNTASSVNANLRNNGTYGFACYASGTGGALTLYKKSDGKKNTGLAYSIANYLVKAGASMETPTLTNPNSLTGITFASSDADVVAVDANSGALTIKAAGVAVITASFAGNDTYKAGSASYTVYVATEAGTAADPLSEASAKALIDLGCTMEAHVHGTVLGSQDATKFTVTLTGGLQFYKLKDLGNVAFESAYIGNGDEVTAVGTLTKYNTTYELAEGCYLTAYTEYTEPLVDISNTKETAYTVAQALALAVNPTSDLTKAVYIAGVVYDVKNFNSTNGTLDIYIKDAGEDNKFEFYKCAGIYDESLTAFTAADDVQEGDEVIGYGVMKYYSGGSIWEFDNTATGDYLVELTRPEVAVSSVELDQNAASIEVNETVTLHATILPDNASDKSITWSVQSGSTYASVENGVVTGLVAGEAVIRAASTTDPTKYAECTITVTAADPTKHIVTFDATVDQGESPLSKSNVTMACSNGVLNNGTEYRLYKSSTTTFECSAGNITKIEFTGVSNNPVSGFGDPEVGSLVTEGKDGVWTGNAASVTFTASGAQVRATKIKVTYKEDNRSAAGLAWSSEAVVLTVGSEFTAPTLTNPNNIAAGEITIASGNTALAVVNDGVVSLVENAIGEATITATFNGNDNYKPATVSYTITVNEAGLDNITFDATTDIAGTNELSITKAGFTLAFTGGAMGNGSEYRLYKGQTMTLSSADYKIKKIEFTCTTGNPIDGFAVAEGLDKENDQWTGEANSVELTASDAQVRITKLKVFYIEDTRPNAGIAYETTEYDATINGTFTTPTLTNSNNLTVTYSSSDQNLAQVDENSGDVTIGAAEGTVTITATFAGNDTYKPGTASYTINIIDPTPVILVSPASANFGTVNQNAEVAAKTINVTLKNVANTTITLAGEGASAFGIDKTALTENGTITISVTNTAVEGTYEATVTISDASQEENAAEPKAVNISMTVENKTNRRWYMAYQPKVGMQVIITSKADDNGDLKAMGAQNTNNRAAVANSVEEGILEPTNDTEIFTLVSAGYDEDDNQLYAIKTSDGGYLYAAGANSNNHLKTASTYETPSARWTISIDANGVATIVATSTGRNWMRYNSSNDIFSCYASAQQNIYLYTNHKQSPSSNTSQSIADITGSDTEEASATKVYVPAGKTLAVATTDPAIPELVVEAKKNVSTQIKNPERITTPDFYLDYQLCDGALDADYWYCIAVPFNVDINIGIYKTDGTKLTNHVDYEVWGYDTEKRAETMSNGWTRLSGGMMQAGHAYLIGFNDGMDNMVRLKAAADWKENLYNLDYLALTAASNGADALGKHSNWNALGNPTTQYKSLNSANVSNVQMFDNNAHTFSTFDLATSNFVVGRPFFIQYGSNIAIEDEIAGGEFRAPKRQSEKMYYEVQIARIGKKYFDNQIIVRASEDATNTYEQGHDVITMNDATSKNAALLWTKNYGDMRLAAEEAPLTEGVATYSLGIFAPANGTYTISVAAPKENADLYLTYEGSIIWNLSASEYTIDLTKGATNGYGLVMKAKAPQVGTGIESQSAIVNGVEKVVINNTIYILRNEQMYDLTGKMVK